MSEKEKPKIARTTGLLTALFFAVSNTIASAHSPELKTPIIDNSEKQNIEQTQTKEVPNYTYYDGNYNGFGRGGGTTSQDSVFIHVFYTYARDNNTGNNILCSGAKVETKGTVKAKDVKIYTTSKTLQQLWIPVSGTNDNIAEYGSCVITNAGELDYKAVDIETDFMGTKFDSIVSRTEPQKEMKSFDFQRKLIEEKYPDLWDLWDQDDRWDSFVADSKKYRNDNSFLIGQDTPECKNAGYFFEQAWEQMLLGTMTETLPLCNRLNSLTP